MIVILVIIYFIIIRIIIIITITNTTVIIIIIVVVVIIVVTLVIIIVSINITTIIIIIISIIFSIECCSAGWWCMTQTGTPPQTCRPGSVPGALASARRSLCIASSPAAPLRRRSTNARSTSSSSPTRCVWHMHMTHVQVTLWREYNC